jgi:hypothetical protein
MGKGGEITLRAGGKTVAGGRIEHSAPIRLAIFEGLDIGLDNGSPVDWTYKLPFKFTGRIDKVTVEVFPGSRPPPGEMGPAAHPAGAFAASAARSRRRTLPLQIFSRSALV